MNRPQAEGDLLADQRAFYRAHASHYDEWWQRRGRYDQGSDDTAQWHRQVAQVTEALEQIGSIGSVLELAGGTGWWSGRLAERANSLTVVDSSPEALNINRERVSRNDITYVVADIFTWRPDRRYDTVFFSFWLSHVPRQRFVPFWSLVASCLVPTGKAFLIDNRRDPSRAAADPYVIDEANDVQRRRLSDGSEHQVIKVFYEPDELADRLHGIGWGSHLAGTSRFIYGSAWHADA
ncbi:class I SAM-dependent methyltransferase [Mycobacterium sp.]|uniref:class I SAM-dependent methyltransferase n=1 Tax=Mycobacterium sp. TaxID=1785 RepID=UPI0025CD061F|nr:class I SAM-dependent methyltransferase [Mycobacterium sp.]MBW0015421.1 class I SAM-dependent methyltransferase [Mycobacterium sp.]